MVAFAHPKTARKQEIETLVETINNLKALEQRVRTVNVLLFDLDGTLVKTDYANYLSYKMAIEQVKKIKLNLTFNPNKRVTREDIRVLLPSLSEEDYMEIVKTKNNLYPDYLHETKLNIMIEKMLDMFSNKEQILITNSRKERASMLLKWHQVIDKFDHRVFCGDMVSGINKFKYVLSILGISASSVVVFENDKSEIEKAISLGIPSKNIFRAV